MAATLYYDEIGISVYNSPVRPLEPRYERVVRVLRCDHVHYGGESVRLARKQLTGEPTVLRQVEQRRVAWTAA